MANEQKQTPRPVAWQRDLMESIQLYSHLGQSTFVPYLPISNRGVVFPRVSASGYSEKAFNNTLHSGLRIPIRLLKPGSEERLKAFIGEKHHDKWGEAIPKASDVRIGEWLEKARAYAGLTRPEGHRYRLTIREKVIIDLIFAEFCKYPEIASAVAKNRTAIISGLPKETEEKVHLEKDVGGENSNYSGVIILGGWSLSELDDLVSEKNPLHRPLLILEEALHNLDRKRFSRKAYAGKNINNLLAQTSKVLGRRAEVIKRYTETPVDDATQMLRDLRDILKTVAEDPTSELDKIANELRKTLEAGGVKVLDVSCEPVVQKHLIDEMKARIYRETFAKDPDAKSVEFFAKTGKIIRYYRHLLAKAGDPKVVDEVFECKDPASPFHVAAKFLDDLQTRYVTDFSQEQRDNAERYATYVTLRVREIVPHTIEAPFKFNSFLRDFGPSSGREGR